MLRKMVPMALACSLMATEPLWADSAEEAGFAYRQTVTFRGYAGASTLADFPVLVKLPKNCFHTFTYRDAFFADADGHALAYEVDSATDTEVLFWVKLPALAGQETSITAWFGRATAYPSAFDPKEVWAAYAGVWHFNFDTPDATGHALDYFTTDNITVVESNGLLGRGFLYESTTDNATGVLAKSPHNYLSNAAQFTLTGWLKPESSPPARATRLIAWKADHLRPGFDAFQNTNGKLYMRGNDGANFSTLHSLDWPLREWSHLALRVDGAEMDGFLNGQVLANRETAGANPSDATFTDQDNVGYLGFGNMGAFANGTRHGDFAYPFKGGEVDELRVYNGLMTADWAAAEHDTVANHDAFTAYGALESVGVDVEERDGVWVSAAATASWLDLANWLNLEPMVGSSSMATFRSPATVAEQTVQLNDMVALTALVQEDAVRRTVTDGRFAFADVADVTVAAGGLDLVDGLAANQIEKKGDGRLAVGGELAPFTVAVAGGELAFRAPAAEAQGPRFELDAAAFVTHLGVAESAAGRVQVTLSSVTHVEATEEAEAYDARTLLGATRFVEGVPGLVKDGFRYLRLPQPITLRTGTTYEVVASDGSAAKCLVSTLKPEQKVRGTLDVAEGSVFKLETPRVSVQGLAGAGTVAAGDEPSELVLSVAEGNEVRADGTFAPGALALTKDGPGLLRVAGKGLFSDGVYLRRGTLLLDSAETIAPGAPITFNDYTGGNPTGVLSVEGDEVTLTNPFYALRTSTIGMTGAGVRALPGQTLTFENVSVVAPDADVPGRQAAEFALHAFANAEGRDPTVVFRGGSVDYLDFAVRVDGLADNPEACPGNTVVLDGLTPRTKLRKLVVQNNARNARGGSVTITGGNELRTDYLDFTGVQLRAKLTGGTTLVAPNVRISDSTPTWETIDESNVDFTVEEGSKLVAKGFPAPGTYNNTRNCTNSVLRLDGGTLQVIGLTEEDQEILMPFNAGSPVVELTEKGGTIDLNPYEGETVFSVKASSPIRSAAGAASAPLTIRGDESLPNFHVNAAMTYAGPTTVDAAVLALNKSLLAGSDITLAHGAKIHFKPQDEFSLQQTYGTLAAGDGQTTAVVNTERGELQFLAYKDVAVTKKGEGTLSVALGMTEQPIMENAKVTVESGTFRIGGVVSGTAEPTLVAEGGFEPDPALPSGDDRNKNDKRGARDAAYLASAFSTWSFANIDGAGLCSRVSYFSEGSQYANEPEDNRHAAFLFNRNGAGWVSRSIDVAEGGNIWELEYSVASSYFNNVTHYCQIKVMLDGAVLETYPETPAKQARWTTRRIKLGKLSRGRHTLAFQVCENTDLPQNSEMRVLLDNVKLGFAKVETGSHVRGLALDLQPGAKLELDFDGQIEGSGVTYDGAGVYGHINAQNHPDFVTGRGTLYVKGGGCYIYFR